MDKRRYFERFSYDTFWAVCLILAVFGIRVKAKEPELVPMQLTCYTAKEGAVTRSGCKPRKGICAVNIERLGLTAVVYTEDYELVGIYECLDTGFGGDADGDGVGSIQEGKVIDIYCDTLEEAREMMKEYGGKKLLVQFIEAEG